MNRHTRIALRIESALEGYEVPDEPEGTPYVEGGNVVSPKDKAVARNPAVQKKLKKWFAERGINIRIVLAHPDHTTAIGKPGVITFQYAPTQGQEPPTAWMIIHNLAHGMLQFHYPGNSATRNPSALKREEVDQTVRSMNEKDLNFYAPGLKYPWDKDKEGMPSDSQDPYHHITKKYILEEDSAMPVTKGALRGFTTESEAMAETFAQWVTTGKIILRPKTPLNARRERELADFFRQVIKQWEAAGKVITTTN